MGSSRANFISCVCRRTLRVLYVAEEDKEAGVRSEKVRYMSDIKAD